MEELKYPIGKFILPDTVSDEELEAFITTLEELPSRLRELVGQMDDHKLNTPYRPEGWTVHQLVHHIADSHHNSYIRFKWALTEDNPVIKVYNEQLWAELPDIEGMDIKWSLKHLEVVQYKITRLLKALSKEQLLKTFRHPESGATINLRQNAGMYAWHSKHHYAHIASLIKREGW